MMLLPNKGDANITETIKLICISCLLDTELRATSFLHCRSSNKYAAHSVVCCVNAKCKFMRIITLKWDRATFELTFPLANEKSTSWTIKHTLTQFKRLWTRCCYSLTWSGMAASAFGSYVNVAAILVQSRLSCEHMHVNGGSTFFLDRKL